MDSNKAKAAFLAENNVEDVEIFGYDAKKQSELLEVAPWKQE